MTGKLKKLEGSGHGLTKESWNLLGGTEKNHE
jgi:hypothetical protein